MQAQQPKTHIAGHRGMVGSEKMISPRVIQAKTLVNHELAVTFDGGQKRKFSMLPYLKYPAFAALKDVGLFNQARVAHGAVIWTDEIVISPDTLYIAGKPD